MNKIDNVYNRLINNISLCNNDYIVGAISGGPDSMCLLNILIKLKKQYNINIVCAHVNHKVRIESDDEYIFVKKYCDDNGVIFEGMEISEKIAGNFESEARKIRYDFFEKIVNKYHAKYLFTAHHGDDLMETILMRIVRGSNINGYYGFSYKVKCKDYYLIRPLILVTKQDIIDYNESNNIPWVDDYTNHDDSHTRNRYRKYILPRLKDEDKNVNLKFLQFSEDLSEVSDYLYKVTQDIINVVVTDSKIDIFKFKNIDHIIQMNIIFLYLKSYYQNDIYLINRKHVQMIYDLLYSNVSNKYIILPSNVKIVKSYNSVYIDNNININGYNIVFDNKIVLPNGHTIEQVETSDLTNNYVCYLDSNDIKLPLIIRTKYDGDKVNVKNMTGHIKLKKIFIDSKINLDDRDLWPIVTDSDNKILWIPGVKKTNYDKQKTKKYDIILRYY